MRGTTRISPTDTVTRFNAYGYQQYFTKRTLVGGYQEFNRYYVIEVIKDCNGSYLRPLKMDHDLRGHYTSLHLGTKGYVLSFRISLKLVGVNYDNFGSRRWLKWQPARLQNERSEVWSSTWFEAFFSFFLLVMGALQVAQNGTTLIMLSRKMIAAWGRSNLKLAQTGSLKKFN